RAPLLPPARGAGRGAGSTDGRLLPLPGRRPRHQGARRADGPGRGPRGSPRRGWLARAALAAPADGPRHPGALHRAVGTALSPADGTELRGRGGGGALRRMVLPGEARLAAGRVRRQPRPLPAVDPLPDPGFLVVVARPGSAGAG